MLWNRIDKMGLVVLSKPMTIGISIAVMLLISRVGFSQTIKTFDSIYYNGKARFQYYEGPQNEQILHGPFLFAQKSTITETGRFSNNLKVGPWSFVDLEGGEQVRVSGAFKEDLKDGVWTARRTEGGKKRNHTLTFKKDTLVGKVDIEGLTGQFSPNGKYIGDWKAECEGYLYKARFIDNILVSLTMERLEDGRLVRKYEPEISSIDFMKLGDETNHIVRQEDNLVGITRVLVDEFQTGKVYGVPDYDEKLQEQLFSYFFDCIESRVGDFLYLGKGWHSLRFSLSNNPDFLYFLEPTREIQAEKIKKRKDFKQKFGPVLEYSQATEKPSFSGGIDSFKKFITSNYRNTGILSGRLFIEGIIARDGKLHIIKTTCSGNLSCAEVNRILGISPSWQPAKQNGEPVNVDVLLPIMILKSEHE